MSADEPFVGACGPEPCTDDGERYIAAMKVDEMIAANTWYPCGYTWRSAKGHTSRIDYLFCDASRVEEIKTCGVAHTVDLACGAAEDHRCVKCLFEVKDETRTEKNHRKKKKINIDTSLMQNPYLCVEFQRRLWTLAPKPGNSVSDHAEEFSIFLLQQVKQFFGVKGQSWISQGTWCKIKVIAPLRRFANQAAECGRFARMKRYFCNMGGDETLRVRTLRSPAGTLQGMESFWNAPRVGTESRPILLPCECVVDSS